MIENTGSIRPVVIIPAFSRPRALRRLLASVNSAHYPDDRARLLISLDGGAKKEVTECARRFEFNGGAVEVVEHEKQLGLREHILWCGDQTRKYGSVIVLEDDLLVDPWFYRYSIEAMVAHDEDNNVAGIALYSPRYNECVGLPFEPLLNGASSYLMQVPCSWGQAWTADQWSSFKEWYDKAEESTVDKCVSIPSVTRAWPASSWKKYFATYLSISERYFVYPYYSYTTNCADPGGAHVKRGTDQYQVPLPDPSRKYVAPVFPAVNESSLVYDPFMEPRMCINFNNQSAPMGSIAIDFYAAKPLELLRKYDYCLTTRAVRSAIANYPLIFRPLPMNIHLSNGELTGGPISLCRSDQLYDHEPILRRLRSRYRLKLYFAAGLFDGRSFLMLAVVSVLKRVHKVLFAK